MISEGRSCAEVVKAYERGGAAALSVLTEERHFGGSLDDLRAAREASHLPILRKDFTVDEYMLLEAKALGADAVLLVVGAFRHPDQMVELYHAARALDLDAIVEVSEPEELEMALEADVDVIGINNRNLEDFSVDTAAHLRAAGRRARGQDRGVGVGHLHARADRGARAGGRRRGAGRQRRHGGRRPRGAPFGSWSAREE